MFWILGLIGTMLATRRFARAAAKAQDSSGMEAAHVLATICFALSSIALVVVAVICADNYKSGDPLTDHAWRYRALYDPVWPVEFVHDRLFLGAEEGRD